MPITLPSIAAEKEAKGRPPKPKKGERITMMLAREKRIGNKVYAIWEGRNPRHYEVTVQDLGESYLHKEGTICFLKGTGW